MPHPLSEFRTILEEQLTTWNLPAELAVEIEERSTLVAFEKGAIVFLRGAPADLIFWLRKGFVKLYLPGANGNRTLIAVEEDLAEMIGSSRPMVSKLVGDMVEEGLLARSKQQQYILLSEAEWQSKLASSSEVTRSDEPVSASKCPAKMTVGLSNPAGRDQHESPLNKLPVSKSSAHWFIAIAIVRTSSKLSR